MSYILDALNKSEQERQQREHGVTLQPLTGVPHDGQKTRRWLPWLGAGVVLAAVAVFAAVYLVMQARQQPLAAASAAPSPAVAEAAAKVSSASVQPAAIEHTAGLARPASGPVGAADPVRSLYQRKGMTAEQAQVEQALPITSARASQATGAEQGPGTRTFPTDEPATVRTPGAEAASAPTTAGADIAALQAAVQQQREAELATRVQSEIEALQARDSAAIERKAATAPPVRAVPVAEPVVPLATELAPALQQRIPSIEFGAHVYAGKTGNGFVILNGKKRYAGDTVAPGLTVQRVTEDGVILDLGGTRFRLESMRSWFN